MGRALEVITGFVTAPSTTFTGLTMAAGDTLTVQNFDPAGQALLLQAWADVQGDGEFRIRSPKLHDQVQGIRLGTISSQVYPLLPYGFTEKLFAQDTLIAELTGSATGSDIETACLMIYYADLPGIDAKLMHPAEIMGRVRHLVTVENTLALGTAGGYSGEEAIDAEFDLLKANTEYALLGGYVEDECAMIGYRSPDFGNMRVGFPGADDRSDLTANWFVRLSEMYDLPLVPVFNASNKSNVLIDGAQDENGTDVTVITLLAELG